jgi:hypothetical protein
MKIVNMRGVVRMGKLKRRSRKDISVSELDFKSLLFSIFSVATRNFLRSICCFISRESQTGKRGKRKREKGGEMIQQRLHL